jgi:RHO1 GDP-GTP exchange protein 1/2
VFWNLLEIIAVNTRLRDGLNKRQRSYAVVERIGDILLDAVPFFEPFVVYGSHQLYGKYEFEKEKGSNPAFAQFVEVPSDSLQYFELLIAHNLFPRIRNEDLNLENLS